MRHYNKQNYRYYHQWNLANIQLHIFKWKCVSTFMVQLWISDNYEDPWNKLRWFTNKGKKEKTVHTKFVVMIFQFVSFILVYWIWNFEFSSKLLIVWSRFGKFFIGLFKQLFSDWKLCDHIWEIKIFQKETFLRTYLSWNYFWYDHNI